MTRLGCDARARGVTVLLLGLLPWTVVLVDGTTTLVFLFGFATLDPLSVVSLPRLLALGGGLPRVPWLLPASTLLYAGALASAAAQLAGWEDGRLPGYLLVFAALAHLGVSYAVLHRPAYTPLPVGPVAALLVAWRCYGEELRADLAGTRKDGPE